MIAFDEAQARILGLAKPVDRETVGLDQAIGRWAAEPVTARRTQPAHDLSAMDGYAVRFVDLPGPWRVIGESAAGRPFSSICEPGTAVRIFTGAFLPDGSDTIVIQEDVTRDGMALHLTGNGPKRATESVRHVGEDFTAGAPIIAAGALMTPARIALAACSGHDRLTVRRPIRVAIASTGDELVPIGSATDGLPDSNGAMLSALLADMPVAITAFGIVADTQAALATLLDQARHHDVIVTTGGASVGDHDLVRPALIAAGAHIDFWKIAMRPGKPVMAGTLDAAIVLGLPGNPVSAFVTAQLLLRPLIARLSGAADPLPRRIMAQLGAALPAVGWRTDFVRLRWSDGQLVPAQSGDSGSLLALADAEALGIRHAGAQAAGAGDFVEAILIA